MGRSGDIEDRVRAGLSERLEIRKGQVVPEPSDIGPRQGVELDATYVYADMAGSSKLAHSVFKPVAAKVIRAYVNTATYILNHWDGEIRSFDGDRVMAIFIGANRNRVATRAAFEINWAVSEVIWPQIEKTWNDTANWGWTLKHGVGVDTGEALLIRTGVRGDNDIASIGEAPNVAAKLSSMRERGSIYITEAVYTDLNEHLLYGPRGESMWSRTPGQTIGGTHYSIYQTTWHWGPST